MSTELQEYSASLSLNQDLRDLTTMIGFSGESLATPIMFLLGFNVIFLHLCMLSLWYRSR